MSKRVISDVATVGVAVSLGAICGSMLNGFGHFRKIYSDNPKKKAKELRKLEDENVQRLKKRMIIGCILGACAGIGLGVLMAGGNPKNIDTE